MVKVNHQKIFDKQNVFANEAIIANILDPKYREEKLPVQLRARVDDMIISKLNSQGTKFLFAVYAEDLPRLNS